MQPLISLCHILTMQVQLDCCLLKRGCFLAELSAGAGAQAPRALDKIFDMGFMSEGSDLESEDDEEEEGADPAGSGNSHERA